MSNINTEVIAELRLGPKTITQLLAAIPVAESKKQIANCLFRLKATGEIKRIDHGLYAYSADRKAPAPSNENAEPPKPKKKSAVSATKKQKMLAALGLRPEAERIADRVASLCARPREPVRAILEKAIADNQAALDEAPK